MITVVKEHQPREFSAICSNKGIVLCDKTEGAFLVLRCTEDLERLKDLLNKITTIEGESR